MTYSTDDVEAAAAVLERASDAPVDRGSLQQRLDSLLEAVGRADGGDAYVQSFQEFAAADPGHAELAASFREVAKARDPLDPDLYRGAVAAELNAAARAFWKAGKWPRAINRPHPIRGMSSDLLTQDELRAVRAEAKRLAAYHRSFVRRQAPNKLDQDTLLEGLADIFLEFAKLDCGRHELPHSENSRFIQFVHGAVRPFFGSTEMSPKAIARRWKRLKDHAATGRPQPAP